MAGLAAFGAAGSAPAAHLEGDENAGHGLCEHADENAGGPVECDDDSSGGGNDDGSGGGDDGGSGDGGAGDDGSGTDGSDDGGSGGGADEGADDGASDDGGSDDAGAGEEDEPEAPEESSGGASSGDDSSDGPVQAGGDESESAGSGEADDSPAVAPSVSEPADADALTPWSPNANIRVVGGGAVGPDALRVSARGNARAVVLYAGRMLKTKRGGEYRLGAWLRTTRPGVTVCLRIQELDRKAARGFRVKSEESCQPLRGRWQQFGVVRKASTKGKRLRFSLYVLSAERGDRFDVDGLRISERAGGRATELATLGDELAA